MEDVKNKISEMLSDEESMKQLSELAEMLMSGNQNEGKKEKNNSSPDMESLIKLAGMAGQLSENDKNTELIYALRPHLSEERRKRADKAVRLLKLLSLYRTAKENGLLNDFLQGV